MLEMFGEKYLQKQGKEPLIGSPPSGNLGIIVVIPCFNEPDILLTLDSLKSCDLPEQDVEVIVLINHSEIISEDIRQINHHTKAQIQNWIFSNRDFQMHFFAVGPVEFRKKWAGAGLARKSGMDEAVSRFNLLNKPEGVIVSLDADTLVDKNYLIEIEKHFRGNPKNVGATIKVEHQKEGLSAKHLEGIQLYEKYLHYYKNAMDFTGYPYPMFTVGSAFAVTAGAYVKRGGMNRRQAGEDFYFLQNLAQQGKIGEITTTRVCPSARLSDRVPFGTGPVLLKWMNNEEDLAQTYNFQAFIDLKVLFDQKEEFYKMDENGFLAKITKLPEPVRAFISEDNFWKEIEDLNHNCGNLNTFQKRFFQKFNAFKILKYLNFCHEHFYKRKNLNSQLEHLNSM